MIYAHEAKMSEGMTYAQPDDCLYLACFQIAAPSGGWYHIHSKDCNDAAGQTWLCARGWGARKGYSA